MTPTSKWAFGIASFVLAIPLAYFGLALLFGFMLATDTAFQDAHYDATQQRPSEQELVGSYGFRSAQSEALLSLKSDHHFEEHYKETGRASDTQGQWQSGEAEFGTYVTLTSFIGVEGKERGKRYGNYTLIFSQPKNGSPHAEDWKRLKP